MQPLGRTDHPYRQFLDAMQEGVWVIDRDAVTTFVNPRMAGMLGYSVQEMVGRSLFDFMNETGFEVARRNLERRTRGIGEEHDFELIHRDGHLVYTLMSASPIKDAQGGYAGSIAGVLDMTERRRAAEALLEAKLAAEQARQDEQLRREEAEKRREIADGLRSILAALNSHQALPEVLEIIMRQAERLLGTAAAAIYSCEPGSNDLFLETCLNLAGDDPCWPATAAAATRAVFLNQESLSPSDVVSSGADFADRAMLALPVRVAGVVRGAAVFIFEAQPPSWDETAHLAQALCHQLGLAIENHYLRIKQERAAVAAERNRLASDLHDSVTQALFSASLVAEVLPQIWERDRVEAAAGLEELRILMRNALAEMRTLLLELRPGELLETRLDELLRSLANGMAARTQASIVLDLQSAPLLPSDVQVAFYRVAQEALQNALKHSDASVVEVNLLVSPPVSFEAGAAWHGEVRLSIRDNGRGMNQGQVRPDQFGLRGMQERAARINAALTVGNAMAGGTEVVLAWRNG